MRSSVVVVFPTSVALALSMTLTCTCAELAHDPSPWTLERVRGEVESSRRRIGSLMVEADTIGVRSSSQSRTHSVIAVKGKRRYYDLRHLPVEPSFRKHGAVDPNWRISYLTPEMLTTVWINDRFCKMSREQVELKVSDTVRYLFYMEGTGWWPVKESSAVNREPEWALSRVLRDDRCRIREDLEIVDSRPCVVVEAQDGETIWLDVRRSCALVRREIARRGRWTIYENSDFRAMPPGLWLPWKLRRAVFRGTGPDALAQGVVQDLLDTIQTVEELKVNCVDDDTFVFTPEPGTLMFDAELQENWQVPGGEEIVLDQVSATVSALRDAKPIEARPQNITVLTMEWLCLIIGAVAMLLGLAYRRQM